ncbi:hypothetical protein BDZ90DRAFT_227092 [Jaminaea rosea]|uniref:Uncharacterized protein n=1 Tax=Jaminaea rosea TaxID=1569628 RepID=A0A316UVA2_9BASI|nr:hypothetical protein BDZ90DRAFT_227092 [Jaminaea rosea]PWN27843.1 hypothetical protein BDZ90DRAFT_227092 [Jaminaea rosea]
MFAEEQQAKELEAVSYFNRIREDFERHKDLKSSINRLERQIIDLANHLTVCQQRLEDVELEKMQLRSVKRRFREAMLISAPRWSRPSIASSRTTARTAQDYATHPISGGALSQQASPLITATPSSDIPRSRLKDELKEGEIEDRYDDLIEQFLAMAEGDDPAPVLAEATRADAHPSLRAYVLSLGLLPSLPHLRIDGYPFPADLQDLLPVLRSRLRRQGQNHLQESVLIGTYDEIELRGIVGAITHGTGAQLNVPASELLRPGELEAWTTALEDIWERVAEGPPAYIIGDGAFMTRLDKNARDRWLEACQRNPDDPAPPSRQQLSDLLEAKLHEQGNKCALCGAELTRLGRRRNYSDVQLRERAAGSALASDSATGRRRRVSGELEEAGDGLDEDAVILTGAMEVMEDGEEDEDAGGHVRGHAKANQAPPRPTYPADSLVGTVLNSVYWYQTHPWAPEPHNASADQIVSGWLYLRETCRCSATHATSSSTRAQWTRLASFCVTSPALAKPLVPLSLLSSVLPLTAILVAPSTPACTSSSPLRLPFWTMSASETASSPPSGGTSSSTEQRSGDWNFLTVGDVEGFCLERRAGKDAFLSADGMVLPMTLASVDRLHDGHGYVPGNIRLILRCHNALRRHSNHDECWISYRLAMLLAVVLSQGEQAAARGTALPKADWLDVKDPDALLDDEGDDDWSAEEDSDYDAYTMAENTCPRTFACFSAATTTTTSASSMGPVKHVVLDCTPSIASRCLPTIQ